MLSNKLAILALVNSLHFEGGRNYGKTDAIRRHKFETESDKNVKKKCFYYKCTNLRTGNKLYCSAACCKKDKENGK